VVAAGSVRPEGRYRVARPGPVRGMPAWLLELLTPPPRPPVGPRTPVRLPHGRAAAYVRGAVDRETAQVAAAAPGTSHATLLATAGKLGQFVGAGALSEPGPRRPRCGCAAIPHPGGSDARRRSHYTTQDIACRGDDFAALQELIETGLAGALTDPGF
jgi:hypothetical protein